LLSFAHSSIPRSVIAAVAGAVVAPAAVPVEAASVAPAAIADTATPAPTTEGDRVFPSESCLAVTICGVKDRIRWGTPAWSPAFCKRIARGVLASARRNDVSPTLLLAVMVNESDLDEKAVNVTMKNGAVYAKDSGLMGIRCIVKNGRCSNGYVRGLAWRSLMDPLTNIELGARELSRWRTGGVKKVTVRVRNNGRIEQKQKYVPCGHRTHAYWAHYNHGPVYISRAPARYYPHRVAALQLALAEALNVEATLPQQLSRLTARGKGALPRTLERPAGARIRKLCSQIREGGSQCAPVATLD
jgi:hypothetical protein